MHRHDIERAEIFPVFYPHREERRVVCVHQLVARLELKIDPARDVLQPGGKHPALIARTPIDLWRRTIMEVLDYHVEHLCFLLCHPGDNKSPLRRLKERGTD